MSPSEEIDYAINGLQSLKLILQVYATGAGAHNRIKDLVTTLKMMDRGVGQNGGICKNIAEAIDRVYPTSPATTDTTTPRDSSTLDVPNSGIV